MIKIEFRFSLLGFCVWDFNRNLLILLYSCAVPCCLIAECPKFGVGKLSSCLLIWRVCLSPWKSLLPLFGAMYQARQAVIFWKTVMQYWYCLIVSLVSGFFSSVVAVIAALMKAGCASFPHESYISRTCFALYELFVETACILVNLACSWLFFLSCDFKIYFRWQC